MNGLLLKDWIYLRKAIVLMALVIVVGMVIFVPQGVSSAAFLIAGAMVLTLSVNAMTIWIHPAGGSGMHFPCRFPVGRFWPPGMRLRFSVLVRRR